MSYTERDKYGMYKDSAGPGPALMGADTLIGDNVVNSQEDDLGEIKEIMLDMRSGQVAYAVLAFGGMLGINQKLFAVPWQALQLDTVNKRFVLNVEKERLKNAPGFDPDAWPDMSDIGWANQVHGFYGTDASGMGSGSQSGMGGSAAATGAMGMGGGSAATGAMGGGSTATGAMGGAGAGASTIAGDGAGTSGMSGGNAGTGAMGGGSAGTGTMDDDGSGTSTGTGGIPGGTSGTTGTGSGV